MKSIVKQRKGFSLIELMVVIAIIGIGASISWESLSNARNQTKVNGACESAAVTINKARSYALAGLAGVNAVRAHCDQDAATGVGLCSVQSSGDGGSSWTDIVGESYAFPANVLMDASLDIVYALPYASPAVVNEKSYTLSAGQSSATLVTSNFKASCR